MTHSIGNNESGAGRLTAIPDLIYPNIAWSDEDYSRLQIRLELFEDFILLSKFAGGQVSQQYPVDPAEVAAALAGLNLNSGLLPRETLFWSKLQGQDRLGVYLAPRVWPVTVRGEGFHPEPSSGAQAEGPRPEPAEGLAWRVPLPGLILVGHGYDYSLWAVTDRPTDHTTPLYLAPCPNVHPEGICRGNVPFPRAQATTMWQAVDSFFSSRFNRDLSNQKSKAYPDCVLDQWRALHQAGAETYPLDDMVATNITLGRLIDAG